GKVLYGDAAVVQALSAGCDTLDVCGAPKAVCLEGEKTPGWAALQAANADAYPLFFCGTPENEPTCVPQRSVVDASFPLACVNGSSVYSGAASELDVDGDSLADAQDNCPAVFNPVRPMDDGVQADYDHDGVGDACDACPLSAGVEGCASLEDLDQDGVANAQDSCRFLANADQLDQDADGKGDACDACPTDANPGLEICPPPLRSVYEVKSGAVPTGVTYRLADLVITGAVSNGVFAQLHESDPRYQGPDYSGVFIFTNRGVRPPIGSRVNVTGSTGFFSGQLQVNPVGPLTVLPLAPLYPAPVVVSPGEVNDAGARRRSLESVLVQVQDVRVTSQEPFNEFFVADTAGLKVRVDDASYAYTMPAVGTVYSSVTGVLAWRNNQSKIEVRSLADLVKAP
ncbi:MAG TPA: thrombospondin type 3 repeat-containing protein, partial [Aggregicoccus sp.]|nr:thrombospondin type 3 repeat-containing protein [Aggregicoccus sp.]